MADKFSKWIESTVEKGEIARHKQFLLFPQSFQKTCTADTQKPGLLWKRVKLFRKHEQKGINFLFQPPAPFPLEF